jgi:hypothetical protein
MSRSPVGKATTTSSISHFVQSQLEHEFSQHTRTHAAVIGRFLDVPVAMIPDEGQWLVTSPGSGARLVKTTPVREALSCAGKSDKWGCRSGRANDSLSTIGRWGTSASSDCLWIREPAPTRFYPRRPAHNPNVTSNGRAFTRSGARTELPDHYCSRRRGALDQPGA